MEVGIKRKALWCGYLYDHLRVLSVASSEPTRSIKKNTFLAAERFAGKLHTLCLLIKLKKGFEYSFRWSCTSKCIILIQNIITKQSHQLCLDISLESIIHFILLFLFSGNTVYSLKRNFFLMSLSLSTGQLG